MGLVRHFLPPHLQPQSFEASSAHGLVTLLEHSRRHCIASADLNRIGLELMEKVERSEAGLHKALADVDYGELGTVSYARSILESPRVHVYEGLTTLDSHVTPVLVFSKIAPDACLYTAAETILPFKPFVEVKR